MYKKVKIIIIQTTLGDIFELLRNVSLYEILCSDWLRVRHQIVQNSKFAQVKVKPSRYKYTCMNYLYVRVLICPVCGWLGIHERDRGFDMSANLETVDATHSSKNCVE